MPAMHLHLASNGFITKRLSDFYVERAKGGAGLIIVGGCYIDQYAKGFPTMVGLDNDTFIPNLTQFTKVIHKTEENVKVCAQLYHSGRYTFPIIIGMDPISSSAEYSRFSKTIPREMTVEDIKREQQAFADAALRAKKSGFDCVEICGNAGYLMGQFLSPLVNKRKDKYGGDFENRVRFPVETIELIKSYVEDFVVGFRMSGDDFMPNGLTYKDTPDIAKSFEKAGIDYINVTGGWHETKIPQLPTNVPEGCYTYLAENIKNSVSVPIFASNRINDPVLAEQILMAEKADAICMGRALIADPYLPMKAKKDELSSVIHCVACNQGCFDSIFLMKAITCLRNPIAGKEAKMELKPITKKKKVMVVGSGPGGLEAAKIARMRGHEVHIFEKEDKIGGLINTVWTPPGRSEFKRILDDYNYWIQKLDIKLHLKTDVTLKLVKEFNPDFIIIATGTQPIKIPIPGMERKTVYWANDAFTGNAPIGNNNVIIGGGATGIELAIFLAKYGSLTPECFEFLTFYNALETETAINMLHKGKKKVTVLEKLPKAGLSIGKTTKWVLLDKCDKLGVKIITGASVNEIGDNYVNYTDSLCKDQIINDVDSVYYATGIKPNIELYDSLKELNKYPVEKVGDVRKPATIMEAIEHGYKVANRI